MMKKTVQRIHLILVPFAIIFLVSCRSTERMLEEGKYEQLISLTKRKIKGSRNKTKYVVALEEAFNRLQEKDLKKMEQLERDGTLRGWEGMFSLARRIESRQEALEPYLPVTDEAGYQATFNFIRVEVYIEKSREKAAQLLYSRALDEISMAREGDKLAARRAYLTLSGIETYYSTYKDKERLMDEAENLGITRVWIDVQDNSSRFTPAFFEEELLAIQFSRLNDRWTRFIAHPPGDLELDYKVVLEVDYIQVGRDLIHEREIVRTKEVEDGWRYVLDKNGNVAKDSLGNDIKEPKWIDVTATILQTNQEKTASISGRMNLINLKESTMVESRPLRANAVFEHLAQRYSGDERALEKNDLRVIYPVPFPNDRDMIMLAVEAMREEFSRALQSLRLRT